MDNVADNKEHRGWLRRNRGLLLIGGPVIFLAVAGYVYLTGGRYESTDDAYIQAASTRVSANIPGRVVEIDVQDNQPVHAGDVLFKLDDRDHAIAVRDAEAHLASVKLQVAALKATYHQRQADVQAAKDTLAYARHEFERQTNLASQGISSQAQLDQARHAYTTAAQQVNSSQHEQENVEASLAENPDIDINQHPTVLEAQAELDRAKLTESYTVIRAQVDGMASKVEQLQVGDYINAAAPLFAIVSAKDIWVEANFKETQLTYMHPGQEATITVDTYPDYKFHGHVASLSAGTGSSFSLLPPENATGNWVKVVQRLPVRISIDNPDAAHRLHAGLSAAVEVDTHHSRLGNK
jgi:membrane fusion protein (multidrug efflux system)